MVNLINNKKLGVRIMEITKEFKGLIDEGYRYKIEGNLISIESLIINLDKPLHVSFPTRS